MRKIQLVIVSTFWLLSLNMVYAETEPETGSDASQQQDERVAYLDPELKKQLALADTLNDHETVWLDVRYPEIDEPRKVLAISKPSFIADKKGAVLLIHDKEQHADWPEVIRPLRQSLPKAGWFTLSVNLPDETRVSAPERVLQAKTLDQVVMNASLKTNLDSGVRTRKPLEQKESTEQEGSDNAEAKKTELEQNGVDKAVDIDLAEAEKSQNFNSIPYDIRSLSHVEKAYEYLESENYRNVVLIGYGQSAELALNYIKAHQAKANAPGFALILIKPFLPESYLLDLSKWLGKDFQAPILEIIDRGSAKELEQAEYRKYAVLRAGVKEYRQVVVTMNNSDLFDESLTRRVRGWLELNAPGLEVGQSGR